MIEAIRAVVAATSADGQRHTLQPGDTIRIDPADGQMWAYLAVRGGIDVDPVLGSRSTDTLSGLGPAPIAAGAELRVGHGSGHRTRHRPGAGPPSASRRCGCGRHPALDWFRAGRRALRVRRVDGEQRRRAGSGVRLSRRLRTDPAAPSRDGERRARRGRRADHAGRRTDRDAGRSPDHRRLSGDRRRRPVDVPIVAQAMPGQHRSTHSDRAPDLDRLAF